MTLVNFLVFLELIIYWFFDLAISNLANLTISTNVRKTNCTVKKQDELTCQVLLRMKLKFLIMTKRHRKCSTRNPQYRKFFFTGKPNTLLGPVVLIEAGLYLRFGTSDSEAN